MAWDQQWCMQWKLQCSLLLIETLLDNSHTFGLHCQSISIVTQQDVWRLLKHSRLHSHHICFEQVDVDDTFNQQLLKEYFIQMQ